MTVRKKLVIAFIFLAGFVVTGISIARFTVFFQAKDANFTYSYVEMAILSVAEINVSIEKRATRSVAWVHRCFLHSRDCHHSLKSAKICRRTHQQRRVGAAGGLHR
ncbi:hypothetical protein FJTKL_13983 [Diaporthe vaccinii]|uniref:Rhodopsin domain-containing protein n=1 Tax=Diaporthe vaccinii TaxID=105482 RepID=A0ABR4E986_9PEZI